jgi:hypothetical protein
MKYLLTLLFCASAFGADIGEMQERSLVGRWLAPGHSSLVRAFEATKRVNNGNVIGAGSLTALQRQAFYFGGATSITGFPSVISSSAGSRTVAVWVYPQTTSRAGIVGTRTAGAADGWALTLNRTTAGTVTYYHAGGLVFQVSAGVPQSRWSHVVVTYVEPSKTATVFFNGRSVNSTNMTSNPGASRGTGIIGAEATGVVPVAFFIGSISDVKIYNRALTDAEIAALYKEGLR